jgi:hypothetical protein
VWHAAAPSHSCSPGSSLCCCKACTAAFALSMTTTQTAVCNCQKCIAIPHVMGTTAPAEANNPPPAHLLRVHAQVSRILCHLSSTGRLINSQRSKPGCQPQSCTPATATAAAAAAAASRARLCQAQLRTQCAAVCWLLCCGCRAWPAAAAAAAASCGLACHLVRQQLLRHQCCLLQPLLEQLHRLLQLTLQAGRQHRSKSHEHTCMRTINTHHMCTCVYTPKTREVAARYRCVPCRVLLVLNLCHWHQ